MEVFLDNLVIDTDDLSFDELGDWLDALYDSASTVQREYDRRKETEG